MRWVPGLLIMAVVMVLAPSAFAADELEPGLVGEYWDMGAAVEDFPTIDKDKQPTVKKVDKQIAFESAEDAWAGLTFSDHYFARWTGVIKVPKDGKYTFFLESDDGSRLFIDGKEAVTNGGLHAMEEKSGEVEVKAGEHEIKVEFFENEGGAGCKLSWQVEGVEKQLVPESALFHKKGAEKKEEKKP